MKKIFIIALSVLFASCASLRLKGSYAESNNYFADTSLSYEEVWARIIDYFAVQGIPITTIDKSSGLIVSSKVSFINHYTREVDGQPLDPHAFVVIPTVRGGFGNILEPRSRITGNWTIVGDWNVRIKEQNNKVMVNVNLMNLDCYYVVKTTTRIPIASTGIFEQGLLDYLTK